MIKVLVVDDDFRIANLHAQFVRRVAGFEVAGIAHTARQAVELAERVHPDLALLDQYLPDGHGSSVVARLRCDVIMLTAAAEVTVVREALGRGVVNYLVKPFTESDLAGRLHAYARYRQEFAGDRTLDQADIDRAVRVLHQGDHVQAAPRKGRSSHTAQLVIAAVRAADAPLTAADLADRLGLSRATAQRYLSDLAADGRVIVGLRYGTAGRPEHLYSWRTPGTRQTPPR
jgi:two-component system CitB family response regulator